MQGWECALWFFERIARFLWAIKRFAKKKQAIRSFLKTDRSSQLLFKKEQLSKERPEQFALGHEKGERQSKNCLKHKKTMIFFKRIDRCLKWRGNHSCRSFSRAERTIHSRSVALPFTSAKNRLSPIFVNFIPQIKSLFMEFKFAGIFSIQDLVLFQS